MSGCRSSASRASPRRTRISTADASICSTPSFSRARCAYERTSSVGDDDLRAVPHEARDLVDFLVLEGNASERPVASGATAVNADAVTHPAPWRDLTPCFQRFEALAVVRIRVAHDQELVEEALESTRHPV